MTASSKKSVEGNYSLCGASACMPSCEYCGFRSHSVDVLSAHLRKCRPLFKFREVTRYEFVCSYCGEILDTAEEKGTHEKTCTMPLDQPTITRPRFPSSKKGDTDFSFHNWSEFESSMSIKNVPVKIRNFGKTPTVVIGKPSGISNNLTPQQQHNASNKYSSSGVNGHYSSKQPDPWNEGFRRIEDIESIADRKAKRIGIKISKVAPLRTGPRAQRPAPGLKTATGPPKTALTFGRSGSRLAGRPGYSPPFHHHRPIIWYSCHRCQRRFADTTSLKEHTREYHKINVVDRPHDAIKAKNRQMPPFVDSASKMAAERAVAGQIRKAAKRKASKALAPPPPPPPPTPVVPDLEPFSLSLYVPLIPILQSPVQAPPEPVLEKSFEKPGADPWSLDMDDISHGLNMAASEILDIQLWDDFLNDSTSSLLDSYL